MEKKKFQFKQGNTYNMQKHFHLILCHIEFHRIIKIPLPNDQFFLKVHNQLYMKMCLTLDSLAKYLKTIYLNTNKKDSKHKVDFYFNSNHQV
jgi:hypothetical protein